MEQLVTQLSKVKNGTKVRFINLDAGKSLRNLLASMGLVPNTDFTVVKNGHPGPFVVNVKNTKVVLGRGLANKITVKYVPARKIMEATIPAVVVATAAVK